MKKYIMILLLVAFGAVISGCGTAHGFGEDMEKAGEKTQDKTN